MSAVPPSPAEPAIPEWFALADPAAGRDQPGLSFSCTMCGHCCSGPEGYVLVTDDEARALAARLNITVDDFVARYTRSTSEGRSLTERRTDAGLDCIFLDRNTIPGKAICGVYQDRPAQCRTWPFWPSNLRSRATWERAKRVCPGMDKGTHYTPVQIRIARDAYHI
jgi:Fe-S-cluster containining protein